MAGLHSIQAGGFFTPGGICERELAKPRHTVKIGGKGFKVREKRAQPQTALYGRITGLVYWLGTDLQNVYDLRNKKSYKRGAEGWSRGELEWSNRRIQILTGGLGYVDLIWW